ncbi:hypothetical protein [Parendozoicomonas haliclonae]|uniref:Uncharacterized protein n=1 Tax=Parendozoicomonas haliclonae TaxID=1960125 RepID=A0A1X7AHH6_9GAMM|nr:hypothetical protein [Parendozoicomonas haliclonae]SMA41800.1 hypothetical protein EHSB41UT_01329 [Parendozoicomonas haliclonae]
MGKVTRKGVVERRQQRVPVKSRAQGSRYSRARKCHLSSSLPSFLKAQRSAQSLQNAGQAILGSRLVETVASPKPEIELELELRRILGSEFDQITDQLALHQAEFSSFDQLSSWQQFVCCQLCMAAAQKLVLSRKNEAAKGLMISAAVKEEYERLLSLAEEGSLPNPVLAYELGAWNLLENLATGDLHTEQAMNLLHDMSVRCGLEPESFFALLSFSERVRCGVSGRSQSAGMEEAIRQLNEQLTLLAQGRELFQSLVGQAHIPHSVGLEWLKKNSNPLLSYLRYLKVCCQARPDPVTDPAVQRVVLALTMLLQKLGSEAESRRTESKPGCMWKEPLLVFTEALAEFVEKRAKVSDKLTLRSLYEGLGAVIEPELGRLADCTQKDSLVLQLFDLVQDILLIGLERRSNDLTFLHGTTTDALDAIGRQSGLVVNSGYLLKQKIVPLSGEMSIAPSKSINKIALSGVDLTAAQVSCDYATDFLSDTDRFALFHSISSRIKGMLAQGRRFSTKAVLFTRASEYYLYLERAQQLALEYGRLIRVDTPGAKRLLPQVKKLLDTFDRSLDLYSKTDEYRDVVEGVGNMKLPREFHCGYAKGMLDDLTSSMELLRASAALVSELPDVRRTERPLGVVLGSSSLSDSQSHLNEERLLLRPALMGQDFQYVFCEARDKPAVTETVRAMGRCANNIQIRELAELKRLSKEAQHKRAKKLAVLRDRILAGKDEYRTTGWFTGWRARMRSCTLS